MPLSSQAGSKSGWPTTQLEGAYELFLTTRCSCFAKDTIDLICERRCPKPEQVSTSILIIPLVGWKNSLSPFKQISGEENKQFLSGMPAYSAKEYGLTSLTFPILPLEKYLLVI